MYKIRIVMSIFLAGVMLLSVFGCSSPAEPVNTPPDFTGFITGINKIDNEDVIGTLAVETHADKLLEKYVVSITKNTALFRLDGDEYTEISFNEIVEKQWLDIWFDGPVAESWPMQAKALQVVITR